MRLRVSAVPLVLVLWPALFGAPLGGRSQARPIQYAPIDDTSIAITFDACATHSKAYSFDRAVFETLKREQVPATIFVSGRWAEVHGDAMAELAASPLIEFGDHSYDHPHMRELAPDEMAREVASTEAALARYGKHAVAFRPPYGEWSSQVLQVVTQRMQLPVVLWDVVSGDPSDKISASGIVRNVLTHTRAGSIIVFHINGRGWKTADAMPMVIAQLRVRGFHFVHLSQLLAGPPHAGGALVAEALAPAATRARVRSPAPVPALAPSSLWPAAEARVEPESTPFDPLAPAR
jgi:peptidoglycan/xylan/chitin deacetylase (PgdA/CDA1 family)